MGAILLNTCARLAGDDAVDHHERHAVIAPSGSGVPDAVLKIRMFGVSIIRLTGVRFGLVFHLASRTPDTEAHLASRRRIGLLWLCGVYWASACLMFS